MVCSRGEHETVQAFDSALSSAPVLVGSRSRHIRCELGHSLQREFHIRTYQKVHEHKGICVTGYTHLCSAGARACCQFGEKRRRAPGVRPLLPSSCAGFFPDSPHLARSPSFCTRFVSISAPFRRHFPSLFFSTPTRSLSCSVLPTPLMHTKTKCSNMPLYVPTLFELLLLHHPSGLFLAALLHLHK